MGQQDEAAELVRVGVYLPGRRVQSSVSMDWYLWALLVRERGGDREARDWVRDRARGYARVRDGGGAQGVLGAAGLSRLVQRDVLRHVLEAARAGRLANFSPEPVNASPDAG